MPFVRNPRDRNKQIETQQSENNALQKDLGTVGSVGGSLLQDTQPRSTTSTAPTLTSPSPERKTVTPRATNLSDFAAANIDKTQALSQDIASEKAAGVRDFNRRLSTAQSDLRSSLEASPDPDRSKAIIDEYRAKAKEGTLGARDYTNLTDAFGKYQGPKTLSEIDPGLAETEANITGQGTDLQTGASGTLQDRLASEGTYSTGARSLDTALLGQQSNALQQVGRAASGVGGQFKTTDDTLGGLAKQRTADLSALTGKTGQAYKDIQADFATQQALQQQGYDTISKKIADTKVDTNIATDYIANAQADYDTKNKALQDMQNVIREFIEEYQGGDGSRYHMYDAIASDPAKYSAYMSDANTHNTDWIGEVHIPTLIDFNNHFFPRINQYKTVVPNGAADVEYAHMKLMTAPIEARDAMTRQYLENFSDEEIARAGTTRDAVIDYARKNDLNLEQTAGIMQQMGVEPAADTQEERDYVAALQYLARLTGNDLFSVPDTRTSKEEGE